jgi:peptidylprolyl isomerase
VVTFHFTAKTMEGESVQDTRKGQSPPSVPLDKLPPALCQIFTEMKTGEQRQAWLPEPQAPGGFIVADLELVAYKAAPPAPAVPEDVAEVPADAHKTDSGLAYKVLSEGNGEEKPKATDTVKVHYSGWTTDGEMFDSSITRGEPTQFPLNGVIKGWTEGVQLMVAGEKRRFWIPAELAYGPEVPGSGRPGGMLVFDIEFLEIVR